jgi:hypothetical protein
VAAGLTYAQLLGKAVCADHQLDGKQQLMIYTTWRTPSVAASLALTCLLGLVVLSAACGPTAQDEAVRQEAARQAVVATFTALAAPTVAAQQTADASATRTAEQATVQTGATVIATAQATQQVKELDNRVQLAISALQTAAPAPTSVPATPIVIVVTEHSAPTFVYVPVPAPPPSPVASSPRAATIVQATQGERHGLDSDWAAPQGTSGGYAGAIFNFTRGSTAQSWAGVTAYMIWPIPSPTGTYQVDVWIPRHGRLSGQQRPDAHAAQYSVLDAQGTWRGPVTVNQEQISNGWAPLGAYRLGPRSVVALGDNVGATSLGSEWVIFDAVRATPSN